MAQHSTENKIFSFSEDIERTKLTLKKMREEAKPKAKPSKPEKERAVVSEKAKQSKLDTDHRLWSYIGFAYMGKVGNTMDAAVGLGFTGGEILGVHVLYNKACTIAELDTGYQFDLVNNGVVAVIPFVNVGVGIAFHNEARTLGFSGNAGLMITAKHPKRVFIKGAYQFNGYGLFENRVICRISVAPILWDWVICFSGFFRKFF